MKKKKQNFNIQIPKFSQKFEDLYNILYTNHSNYLEKTSKLIKRLDFSIKTVEAIIILNLICQLIIPLILISFTSEYFSFDIFSIIVELLLIFLVTLVIIRVLCWNKYTKYYKSNIITPFINSMYPNYSYNPNKLFSKDKYSSKRNKANFSQEYYQRSYITDYMSGSFNKSNFFELCYVKLKKYRDQSIYIFNGLFCEAHINRDFGPYTKISTNSNITDDSINNYYELFDISYSNEALTSKFLINNILIESSKFYKKTQMKFEIILEEKDILFRFHTGDIFDPGYTPLKKNLLYQRLYLFHLIIKFIRTISLIKN